MSNQSVIKMKYIRFDAAFDALSESVLKKMEDTLLDTLLVKILSPDSIFDLSAT